MCSVDQRTVTSAVYLRKNNTKFGFPMHTKLEPCPFLTNVPPHISTFFVPLILSFKCLQRCGRAAKQREQLMFLMAHGLSPGGEINMGKRLKPQAFFHNLLPSSSFPLQWTYRAGTADSNSKPNSSGPWGIRQPEKHTLTIRRHW